MSDEIFGFDEEDHDRISRMAREHGRRMGDRELPEDFRSVGRIVSVRITGPADGGNAGMFPGTIVGWKPGALSGDTGTPTTGFTEYDDVWYAEENDDGNVASDCWVKVGIEGFDDDLVGTTVPAIVVGAHPDTDVIVALWTPGTSVRGGCGKEGKIYRTQVGTKLTTTSVAGNITSVTLEQRFRNITISPKGCYTFGDPYCVAAYAVCDDTEGDGPKYWCVGGACYKVFDGITPGGSPSGPYDTADACHAACDPDVWPTVGTSCPGGYASGQATTPGVGSTCVDGINKFIRTGPFTWTCSTLTLTWDGVTGESGFWVITDSLYPTTSWSGNWSGEFPDIPNGVSDTVDLGGGGGGPGGTDRWISCCVSG